MLRPLLPKGDHDRSSSPRADAGPDGRSSKRRAGSSACVPCRRRKSKCDGGTPSCSTCLAVYHTECAYDGDDGLRRKAPQMPDGESSRAAAVTTADGGHASAMAVVLSSMRASTESEATEILQQLRSGQGLERLAESLTMPTSSSTTSTSTSTSPTLGPGGTDPLGSLTVDSAGETRYYGHTSSLGLVPIDDDILLDPLTVSSASWTRVTDDAGLISHLLALYFCWQHPLYLLFSQDCFLRDMSQGRAKYCSAILLNALLACGCRFVDPVNVQADPVDYSTLGHAFFAEARRLLNDYQHSSLTTVQALALMSLYEASCGRDSSGFHFVGRSIRMAIELGLHLSFSAANSAPLTPTEIQVRRTTFWGCFNLDTIWALSVGRISQLPLPAIRIEKPTRTNEVEMRLWKPYGEPITQFKPELEQPGYRYGLLHQMSTLSEIANDAIHTYDAPRQPFTSRILLQLYDRYRSWYQALPVFLQLTNVSTPQVIYLHMYYQIVVLHLFRPLWPVHLVNSDVSPRQVCTASAERFSMLADQFDRLYGLQRACLLLVSHCILSASTIHLLNLPSPTAARHLQTAVHALGEMSFDRRFATRCLRIIRTLAQKWRISLPPDVERASTGIWPLSSPATAYFPMFPIGDVRVDTTPESTIATPSALTGTAGSAFWTPFPDQGYTLQAEGRTGAHLDGNGAELDGGGAGSTDMAAILDMEPDHSYPSFAHDGFRTGSTPSE